MNKVKYLSLFVLVLIMSAFINDTVPKEFAQLLVRSKLDFVMPDAFLPVKCILNTQMDYDYALKSPGKKFEIRYAIVPMDSALVKYERRKKRGEKVDHPNKDSEPSYRATLLNIGMGGTSNMQLPKITYLDSTTLKKEFHADWGASAVVDLGSDFGQDYRYCLTMILHKDFTGDAYIFFLYDDKEDNVLAKEYFHTLKFK
jgi:hypothetical protein